jgi:hypothetical protein
MPSPRACTRTRKAPKPRLPLFTGKLITRDQLPAKKEIVLHFSTANFLDKWLHADWRYTHFPAGELRHPKVGEKLKRMGLKTGWPDFQLIAPTGLFYALELKRQGEGLNEDQEAFAEFCRKNGIPHAVADTFKQVVETLNGWGCLRIKFAEVL